MEGKEPNLQEIIDKINEGLDSLIALIKESLKKRKFAIIFYFSQVFGIIRLIPTLNIC